MQREKSEALERASKAEKELAEFKSKIKPPVAGDYDDNAKYTADVVQHKLDTNEAQRREQEIAEKRSQADEITARTWAEKAEIAVEKYPDFHAKVNAPDLPIAPAMRDAIIASPIGAEIAYELASNVSEAARISRMSPVEQIMAIGAIASRLETVPPKKVTQAPEPIKAVEGRGAGGKTKSPSDMTYAEFKAYREAGGKL
jgi:hypothetical protein